MSAGLVGADALLSEADGFYLSTGFGYDDVGFGWVVWGALWLVVACDAGSGEPWVAFWFACCHLFYRSLWSLSCPPVRRLGRCSVDLVLPSPPIIPPFRYLLLLRPHFGVNPKICPSNDSSYWLMIQNDELALSAVQQRYVDWLCTAPGERQPATKKAMAVELGVDITTLRRWEKKQVFRDVWKAQVDEVQGSPERTQRLLDTLYAKALDGDTKSAQLYLQATNRMAPPTLTVQTGKKTAELSDSELDELIAAVAEREKQTRAQSQLRVV